MRLGTFWGLTAPMLVIAYDDVDEAIQAINFTRETIADNIIGNLHTELYFLKQAADLLQVRIKTPEGGFFSEYEPTAQFYNGQVINASCQVDVAIIDFTNELTIKIAQKILDGEKANKFVKIDFPVRSNLEKIVREQITTSDIACSDADRIAGKIYRSLKSAEGVSVESQILNDFSCEMKLPETFMRNGHVVKLTEPLKKIFYYFYNRRDDIERLFSETYAAKVEDTSVFGMPISDFMMRKPNFLEYITVQWFQYAVQRNNVSTLLDIMQDYEKNLDILEDAINNASVYDDMSNNSEFADVSKYDVSTSLMNPEQYTPEELTQMDLIFHKVNSLTPEVIASKIGITESEFGSSFRDACDIGICGLNSYSTALFDRSVNSVVITDKSTCTRSAEYLDSARTSVENARALLRNIKPLGAAL